MDILGLYVEVCFGQCIVRRHYANPATTEPFAFPMLNIAVVAVVLDAC